MPKKGGRDFELETVDIDGVEIFAAGGPYHGKGSPPEGDFYTKEEVEQLAADTQTFVEKGLRSVLKIGHSAAQKLAKTLGIDEDELPALGTQTNFRVNDDGKVVADWKRVPKTLAEQIEAGRWPSRSTEIHRKTIDGDTKLVFGATGLLGAKPPAVSTLAEIAALHSEPELVERAFAFEPPNGIVDFAAEGSVVWNPRRSLQAVRNDVQEAIDRAYPAQAGMDVGPDNPRLWVCDVSSDGTALVTEGYDDADGYVVPFSFDADGTLTIAARDEWTSAEKTWVAKAAEYADRVAAASSDTTPVSKPKTSPQPLAQFSDEQIEAFATGFGIDEPDAEKRRAAVAKQFEETAPAPADGDDDPDGDTTPADGDGGTTSADGDAPAGGQPVVQMSAAEVAVLRAGAEAGVAANKALKTQRIESLLDTAVAEFRLDPAKKDEWRGYYDTQDEEFVTKMLGDLPVNEDLRVYGSDEDGMTQDDDDALYAAYAAATGVEITVTGKAA